MEHTNNKPRNKIKYGKKTVEILHFTHTAILL